jgi:hypothetical protein
LIEDEREHRLNKYTSVGSLSWVEDVHVVTFETNVHPVKKVEDLVQIYSCLKDILVGTEIILFCGPRYFGIFRERTRLCVDGEDGIG